MSQLDDLVRKLATDPRDVAAWEALFVVMWPFVLTIAHQRMSPSYAWADAEDLAQDVLFKLSRLWHARELRVESGESLRALLAVMTKRMAVDRIRRDRRQRRDKRREVSYSEALAPADECKPLTDVQWRDLLQTVLENLDSQQRQILDLRLQGYQVAQIAAQMQVSERSVERKLFLIKQLLRTFLDIDD